MLECRFLALRTSFPLNQPLSLLLICYSLYYFLGSRCWVQNLSDCQMLVRRFTFLLPLRLYILFLPLLLWFGIYNLFALLISHLRGSLSRFALKFRSQRVRLNSNWALVATLLFLGRVLKQGLYFTLCFLNQNLCKMLKLEWVFINVRALLIELLSIPPNQKEISLKISPTVNPLAL